MTIAKCPKCNNKNAYLFDEESSVSIQRETFDYEALFCCDKCGFEKKVYLWGSIKIDNDFFKDTL